ncbi:mitogen-activated protein kinase, putative, partial [Bodo saltans]
MPLEEDDEDNDGAAKSIFTEVLRIEEAYDKLQAELKKVKSFLPQSVLKQLEQQDDDDDEGDVNCDDEGTLHNGSLSTATVQSGIPTHPWFRL